jgi:heat shock protein HtpX
MNRNKLTGNFLPSLVTLLLFGALFLYIAVLITDYFRLSPFIALAVPVILTVLQYIFFPLLLNRLFSDASWHDMKAEYPELPGMLEERLGNEKTVLPLLGIYPSPFPFTCTYGHRRNNCRVIISQGMLDILTREEQLMVLLHELHHVRSRDFIVMMCTGLIPFLLYSLTRFTLFMGVGMATMKGTRSLSSFGLMLWWIKNLLYGILYSASRGREGPADRFVVAEPSAARPYFDMIQKIKTAQQSCSELSIRIEKMAFSLNFLSINDPFPGYYQGLSASIEQHFNIEKDNRWLPWFELFSSHPLPRCRESQPEKKAVQTAEGAALQSQTGRELALYLLPFILGFAGSLPALLKGGWLGLPFLLAGLSMIVLMKFHYPATRQVVNLPLQELQPGHCSALTGIPVKFEGCLSPGEGFAIDPLLFLVKSDAVSLPMLIRAFFPADAVLTASEENVTVTGWLRKSPFIYMEARKIRKGKKHIYHSYYPLLLHSLSWGSLLFGIFLSFLQLKAG